ncbi:MAG: S9 family peptidase [Pseudonocardiales bacterium]|nr:S9 family peptidase [Pseudonocardiales bacterium]
MAAVAVTRNPELYAAAVCSGALTDMIRYLRFDLGQWWRNEFGDPEDPTQLDTLLSYSPYHRVTPGTAYPAVLLTSARHDPHVGAAHTRKFTAALQHATSSDDPIVLRTEDGVGHGPRAASRTINAEADALAFCATHTGLDHKPLQPTPGRSPLVALLALRGQAACRRKWPAPGATGCRSRGRGGVGCVSSVGW